MITDDLPSSTTSSAAAASSSSSSTSYKSWRHTYYSAFSAVGALCVLSVVSLLCCGSIASVASVTSVASVASISSVASVASINSVFSIGCTNKWMTNCWKDGGDSKPSWLFGMQVSKANFSGSEMRTSRINVTDVFAFTDRPDRQFHHLSISALVSEWDRQQTFATDPPNAVITFLDDDTKQPRVAEINSMKLDGSDVVAKFKFIDGEGSLSYHGGVSIVIDDSSLNFFI